MITNNENKKKNTRLTPVIAILTGEAWLVQINTIIIYFLTPFLTQTGGSVSVHVCGCVHVKLLIERHHYVY